MSAGTYQYKTLGACNFVEVCRDGNEELAAAYQHIRRLEADLEECREYLEDYSDISHEHDEDGSPRPNRAMQLCSQIDETLAP